MVGFASLWILGLALILTALGFADYHAKVEARRLWAVLKEPGYQAAVNAGLALFSLGLLGSARAWWETALWGLLAAVFLAYAAASLRALRPRKED
jgi:hypothetical protein